MMTWEKSSVIKAKFPCSYKDSQVVTTPDKG